MENLAYEGFVVIEDRLQCDGESLLAALAVTAARKRQFVNVQVVLLNARKLIFERKYPKLKELGVVVVEAETINDVATGSCSQQGISASIVFLDSVTNFLLPSSVDKSLQVLKTIARKTPVVTRVFTEDLSECCRRRLYYAADVLLCLTVADNGSALCHLRYFKKSGKRVAKTQSFFIDEDLKITVSEHKEKIVFGNADDEAKSGVWELPSVPFDLGLTLSEDERKAKESLELPYILAQNEKALSVSVSGNKKVRIGGRIIYTPDEADDFDDSDPDDDLQI